VVYKTPLTSIGVPLIVAEVAPPPAAGPLPGFARQVQACVRLFTFDEWILFNVLKWRPE